MTKYVKIYNGRDNSLVGDRIRVADSFWTRFKGLMLAPDLKEGEGLIITPCNSIHMMFMRYPIDAVFIDASNKVVALYENLRPWIGLTKLYSNVVSVIELPSGLVNKLGLKIDDTLRLEYLQ